MYTAKCLRFCGPVHVDKLLDVGPFQHFEWVGVKLQILAVFMTLFSKNNQMTWAVHNQRTIDSFDGLNCRYSKCRPWHFKGTLQKYGQFVFMRKSVIKTTNFGRLD